jgi:hypothetical protein
VRLNPVATHYKALVCDRSLAVKAGSNPVKDSDVSLF